MIKPSDTYCVIALIIIRRWGSLNGYDELAALQAPPLNMGLAEGRKYGGCFIGFQSKPQLEEIYGRNGAESMLDLFNTKLFFRCTEPFSQQWISKVLGHKEEAEPTENISYGANSTRNGVSLSRHTRQKPLVCETPLIISGRRH